MNTSPMDATPIRNALGADYEALTSLQQTLVDFADRMHQRFMANSSGDDADELVSDNERKALENFTRIMSNFHQLMIAQDTEVYNDTAAADIANIALIVDLCQNKNFVA